MTLASGPDLHSWRLVDGDGCNSVGHGFIYASAGADTDALFTAICCDAAIAALEVCIECLQRAKGQLFRGQAVITADLVLLDLGRMPTNIAILRF